jgi:hypothetical protein
MPVQCVDDSSLLMERPELDFVDDRHVCHHCDSTCLCDDDFCWMLTDATKNGAQLNTETEEIESSEEFDFRPKMANVVTQHADVNVEICKSLLPDLLGRLR